MKKYLMKTLSVMLVAVFVFLAVASGSSESTPSRYSIEVKEVNCFFMFDGYSAVEVTYSFTNNSSDTAMFYTSFITNAYQDGICLDKMHLKNVTTNIKSGTTVDVVIQYTLINNESDVVIEVEDFESLSNDIVLTHIVKLK